MKKTAKRILKTIVSLTLVAGLALPGKAAVIVNAKDGLPDKYDLRDDGLVTPVKFQNPWGTCWAFGGVAAIEASLLSYMGETVESYKEKTGEDFNISEKHLAWFAKHPVTKEEAPGQEGEGLYPMDPNNQADVYSGGAAIMIGTLLASGIGPVFEKEFPYQGKEGITAVGYYEKNPDALLEDLEKSIGCTVEEKYEKDKKDGTIAKDLKMFEEYGVKTDAGAKDITVEEYKRAYLDYCLRYKKSKNCYSDHDDWTIDEKDKDGNLNRNRSEGFVLSDANSLPEPTLRDEKGNYTGVNEEGIRAIKKELLSGRGVSISYHADTAQPGQESDKTFINPDTWAHYTYEDNMDSDHIVCIVGWDDTYSKNNFNKGHRPPEDGAFIVKNSWGSETEYITLKNGEKIGCTQWGVTDEDGKHTGYFYLSYYDKSLTLPESMTFSASIYKKTSEMDTLAYDFMPGTNCPFPITDRKPIKTANVFKNDSGKDIDILSMSSKTCCPNAQVLYEIYKLKDGAKSPEDGEYVGKRRAYYDYAGFHREDLITPVTIKNGESFSIVTTETSVDDSGKRQYEYSITFSFNKETCEKMGASRYAVAVVNKGESYLYRNDDWFDWTDVMGPEMNDSMHDDSAYDSVEIDNFAIKAYVTETGKE